LLPRLLRRPCRLISARSRTTPADSCSRLMTGCTPGHANVTAATAAALLGKAVARFAETKSFAELGRASGTRQSLLGIVAGHIHRRPLYPLVDALRRADRVADLPDIVFPRRYSARQPAIFPAGVLTKCSTTTSATVVPDKSQCGLAAIVAIRTACAACLVACSDRHQRDGEP
jgi:hypothetical protein